MIAAFVILAAMFLDALAGEPSARLHPVVWMGNLIGIGRDWALRGGSHASQFIRGVVLAVGVPVLFAVPAWGIEREVSRYRFLPLFVLPFLLKPFFAMTALRDEAFHVRDALLRDDLPLARYSLRGLCSRDADDLDAPLLAAATVESVAENASDSIVAPLFFFAIFGLAGAVAYRAVNTLDAMIGYRGKYEWVGKASARLDDVLNLVPARITAFMFLLVGGVSGLSASRGFRVLLRDRRVTSSPNAGWPMSVMSGLLPCCLEKRGHYTLGREFGTPSPLDISRAWAIVRRASVTFAVGIAVLLFGWDKLRGT